MPTPDDLRAWLGRSLTYADYLNIMTEQAEQSTASLNVEDVERIGYTKLNLHRSQRISRTHTLSAELTGLVERLPGPQTWLVLTEPWCGDSAQCLPYIAAMAAAGTGLDLRILLRDENLEVMDLYLTNGSRSIPRLVIFDADGNEQLSWGPRPAAAQEVFAAAKAEGLEKPDLLEKLHLFYGRDRGRAIEGEFITLLRDDLDQNA